MPLPARLCTDRPASDSPSSDALPSASGSRPMIDLSSDDLPAPFAPSRTTTSPLRTSKLTSRTATRWP